MRNKHFNMILFWVALLAQSFAFAGNTQPQTEESQSLEIIHEQAMSFLKQKVDQKLIEPKIQLKKLNQRLRLPQCQSALEIVDRSQGKYTGRVTLGVKCHSPSWQTFVTAKIDGKLPVVVSTQGILKQAVIKPEDVKLTYLHYKKVPNDHLISAEKAIGMRAKKAIAPNEVLIIRDLQPPYWVLKKHNVTLITQIGGIEVKTKGVALQSAVERQQVEVENSASKKVVKGIVIAPNTVLVP